MSDEKVRALVAWAEKQHSPLSHDYIKDEKKCETCRMIAAAKKSLAPPPESAHGLPVVDAVSLAMTKLAAEFDELAEAAYQECEYSSRDVWRDAAHDCRNRSKRADWIAAALSGDAHD